MSDEPKLASDLRALMVAGKHSTRPQPTASVDAEPVAVIRFDRGIPGNENEMPKVISCDWQPDGEYRLYTEAQMQARADAARRAALGVAIRLVSTVAYNCRLEMIVERYGEEVTGYAADLLTDCAQRLTALKENPNAG